MSQPGTFGVPVVDGGNAYSPEEWASLADGSLDALLSCHIGSSAPSYAVAGTYWIDNSSTPWMLNLHDGTDDIAVCRINATQNAVQWRWYKGADVASASALTLGSDGNYFDITGTTAITSIGSLGVGTMVMLQFDGALTLTHHATDLVLPGGTDMSIAAGDHVILVEYASGDWRLVAHQGVAASGGSGSAAANLLFAARFAVAPWQRGTSFDAASTPANNDDTYLADRWVLISDGNDIVDVSQDSDGSLLATVQTANRQFGFVQIVAAVNCSAVVGEAVSVAARLKASGLATFRLAVLAWDGTADAVTSDVVSSWAGGGTEPTWASNWTREGSIVDITATGSFATAKGENIDVDTASAKQVAVVLWLDDTDGSVSDTLNIEWISLVAGATHPDAPDFVNASVELHRCADYFERIPLKDVFVLGNSYSASAARGAIRWCAKRIVPSVTLPAAGSGSGQVAFVTASYTYPTVGSNSVADITKMGCRLDGSGYSGLTAGGISMFISNGESFIDVDAEI